MEGQGRGVLWKQERGEVGCERDFEFLANVRK